MDFAVKLVLQNEQQLTTSGVDCCRMLQRMQGLVAAADVQYMLGVAHTRRAAAVSWVG
jgi:hypothetical protein